MKKTLGTIREEKVNQTKVLDWGNKKSPGITRKNKMDGEFPNGDSAKK